MDVLMPQLGETVAEGKIIKWLKSAGDAVRPGENLFEVETDKVSMEVPSIIAGVLAEIRVPAGKVAAVGAVVAVIADGVGGTILRREAGVDVALDPFFELRTPERNFGPARLRGGIAVTPLARRLAAESAIDLAQLRGSGPRGRIVARDVENAPRIFPAAAPSAQGQQDDQTKALYAPDSYVEVPLDAMRRTIAARLTQAQTVPHFYLSADIDIGRLLALRKEANEAAATDGNGEPVFKFSLNDFFIRALALALQRVPTTNAVWACDRILRFRSCDIGVAIALDKGLVAPIVRNAESKALTAISAEIKDISARARAKKLVPADYRGGSSTLSNLGMHGVREFSAIINPPHATILAVGAARRQAVETADGGVAFASVLTATLSCDHRVVDGALGAELLAAFKSFVEMPVSLLV